MLQTVKSSFLLLVIFTMSSAVYAADNNGDTKQPETIIHKAGTQVKSTRIYDGVPSQQYMDAQGKSIEEIKGPDMSAQETPADEPLYRGAPISSWSTEDYINVTPQKFHNALRNQTVPSNKSYRPKVTVVPGDETNVEQNVEQRTAPISTWSVQDYLNVTPQSKHRAINEMQKAPIVTPGETTDTTPRTRPISEFSKEDYLKISPPSLHDAINNEGGTFTVGSSRSYDEITITVSTDTYPGESSWNLYDSTAGDFYYAAAQTFTDNYETHTVTLELQPGDYAVVTYDSYGDGGMTGTVADENGIVLVTINHTGWGNYSDSWAFTVSPPTYDVTISLSTDNYSSESSWQLFDDGSAAVTTLQTFSYSYETQTMTVALEGGAYELITYDSWGDGGMSGTVSDADGNTLATVNHTTGNSQSWNFAIGLYDVTVALETDGYASESSWNLYGPYNDTTASAYYYSENQTFAASYTTYTTVFSLAAGDYSVDLWDSWGDGGLSGTVTDADGNLLITIIQPGGWPSVYSSSHPFEVVVPVPVSAGLFFSEYIEGSSYNKALELYNPTEDTLNLAYYRIAQATNGGGFGTYYHTFPTGATLPPGEVWTVVNSSTSSDYFDTSNASELQTYVVNGNGDDARGLETTHDGGTTWTLIDIIGDPDNDPGTAWEVAGVNNATKDHTLIRKPLITVGNIDWTESAGTHADTSEWIVYDQNYFTNLGGHPDDPCWGTALTFVFNTGGYGYEVQYYMTGPAGDTLFSCFGCHASYQTAAATEVICADDGVYTLWGKDAYGDTWNGGNYEVTDADGNVVASGTGPPSGSTDWHTYILGVNIGVASGSEVNYDGLVLNDSETVEMLVVNTGFGAGATMTLDSVSTSGASFSASATGLPDTIAAGASTSVSVTYTPTTAGDHEGYVILTHSGPGSPDSVMVSGFGVDGYFYEGFDPHAGSPTDFSTLPMDGWTILDNNNDADSIPQQYKTWYHDDYGVGSSGNMVAYSGYSSNYDADEQMITPVIHTPDLAKLSFKTYDYAQYLGVGYSVDGTTFMGLAEVYVDGYWQQHDLSLPEVDSLWLEFTFDPDSGYSTSSTYLNIDEVKVVSLPNTYMDGWVYDQDTDLGVGNVSVMLNGSEVTTTGENELYLDPGFEDSSFVSTYLTPAASDWWVYSGADIVPTTLTNFAHMTDGDLVYVDTTEALGANELSVHEGDKALKMWGQNTGAENHTAIYKQIGAVSEGQEMYVGAWAMSHSDGPLTGGTAFFVAINWLASDFSFIGQDQSKWLDSTYIVHSDLDWNEWHYMDVHGVAPAGVAYVQLQLTFYQPIGYATGSVYVDAAQATMHPGHYNYRGMDEGDYSVMYSHDDYNSASFAGVGIEDDVADTTRLDAGLAPESLTDFEAGFEADQDSGSTVITSGSASFMVMDSLRLSVVDSTVFTDTTSTGADTTWTVYDTTEYNVDSWVGDGMLVYGPTGSQGSVYEDSAYAMWLSGETIDITPYMAEGGNLSMNYRRNMDVAPDDYFYVGVMTDDSTVWWGDYNNHTGSTFGNWYYQSADLTWLRELSSDSVTTVTPIIIFESNDTIVSGWGGAFDDFHVDGNPWFLPTPGKLHSESFQGTYVPLYWEDPVSSGRVTYEVRHFNLSDLGNMQLPREYDSFTVSSDFDNSAMSRDAVSFTVHRRHWDGSENAMIGEWEPLAVTTGNSYFDFSLEGADRADYHITVRYEGGDSPLQSNNTHAAVEFPYVMLADSFDVETFSDSVMPDYWSRWSSTGASSFEVGDSASFTGNTGATNSLYWIPEHPDSAGTFAAVNNPREQGTTVLFSPYLDFSDHQSVVLNLKAWAMTYYDYYPQDYAYGDGAAVYVRSQSNDWHLAVALNYRHTDLIYPYTNPDGWAPERADLGWLLGGEDRVQFKIEWRHGTNTYSYGNGLAIDDFSVSALEGPSGLMASSSTDSVLLEWMGAGGGGRSVPLDPNWTPLSHEEKMLLIEQSSPNVDEEIILDELSFGDRHNIVSPEVTVSQNNRTSSARQGGDTFADAVAITLPYTGSGSTVGYAHDYGPYNDATNLLCGGAQGSFVGLAGDVVYKLTLTDTMEIVVDLDNSLYDTALGVYDSLGTDSVALVLANDDYNGLQSYVQCHLPPGTYYIVVDGYNVNVGLYEIAVYQIIPPDIGARLQTVWKDGMIIADELPDSVFSYTDHNVSLNESCYSISSKELMWVSPEFVPYMMVEGLVGDWVGSDHSNIECAAMVNTPPGAFALVTPPDGQDLVITHDNIGSNQIFAWSASVDPNGSTVTYHAALRVSTGTDTLEISADTTGTAILIPYAAIADVMTAYATATGNYTADVSWTVYADDGWDEIEASNGPRSVSIDIGWYLGMNDEAIVPDVFALHQNYPNPFNPVTTIRYDIPEQALVRIDIYNILGQKVAVLAEGFHEPGFHAVTWNGTNMYGNALSSGMYFYHIKAGDFRNVKKLLLVK